MSDQERHIHSSEGMISEEIDSCIEEYRSFIQKSKNIVRCPEEMSTDSYDEVVVSKGFVDSLTAEEVYNIAKKVYSSWDTTKTQQKYGEVVETSKVSRLQDSEPTTQSEEAVISFEDAKSETAKQHVKRYDIEKLIEAELKEIGNAKSSKDYISCPSTDATLEDKCTAIEIMDFSEIEKKTSDISGIADLELSQNTLPVLKRTDVLEVLLRIYESVVVDSGESAAAYFTGSNTEDISTRTMRDIQEFQKHLVDEMKIIYERLARKYPSGTHRAPENIETSDSESSILVSSSSRTTPSAVLTPSEQSTSAYPDQSTQTTSRRADDTLSSRPLETMDSNSSVSGFIEPVIDMADAQPKSYDSSSEECVSNATNTSSTVSEENNTMSGISSLITDPRVSVSSLRDVDLRISMSSLRDVGTGASVSSLKDVYPRSSVSSLRDEDHRSSLSSLRDVDNVLPQQLLSEDGSDDAFLTAPLVATAETLPSTLDTTDATQNPRRRGRPSKEDEDKNEAKRPAL